jgi:15-cis-phytoene synthase
MTMPNAEMAAPSARPLAEGWPRARWARLEQSTRAQALAAESEAGLQRVLERQGRHVLRSFSTSFFLATRFLPTAKRRHVELVYAAVRYPDEIVDTFVLDLGAKREELDGWRQAYRSSLEAPSERAAIEAGAPTILAGFARVVREKEIPPEHYLAFLEAMRFDLEPGTFRSLDELIEGYIYGSAIVVGYFLAYIYGSGERRDFERTLETSRRLGIALQLTNFVRDLAEDSERGRLYLPTDALAQEGIVRVDPASPLQQAGLRRVLRQMAAQAEADYAATVANLDAFAADTRTAIAACIAVYRELNQAVASSERPLTARESVPTWTKFQALPPSKYWRLPLAYLGAL